MDPQTTTSVTPLTTMLHNATIDKAERHEFSNSACDMFKHALEESSHPRQGTEPPALQRLLTTTDENYNHVLAPNSLTLPHELVERILLLLDTKSMLKCRLINREFNTIIQSSTLVQYFLACKAVGVIDNPQSPLAYAERLEALKRREDAWRELKPVFEMTIKVVDRMLPGYELRAGNFFLHDENQKNLYYCHLPASPQDDPQWRRIPGHGPEQSWSGSMVETGVAVYEHDLIVNVISSQVGNPEDIQQHSLDLVLLKFSTREYHPFARHPQIHVQRSPSARPYSIVTVVGDNLALVVHDQDGSKLFVFSWKTGHMRLQHKATEDAYDNIAPVFVSTELLLVPNCSLAHFEVWHLFPSHPNSNPPVQILSLKIPTISDNYSIIGIRCHGEPSPFSHSVQYIPPRPFSPSAEDSIIMVNLRLLSPSGSERSACNLIMHRHALLNMIEKRTSPSLLEQKVNLPAWFINKVTVHAVVDPDDGLVRHGAQSEKVFAMSGPSSTPRTHDFQTLATSQISSTSSTSHISTDSNFSSTSLGLTSYDFLEVRWGDWGPPISRWFQLNGPDMWRTKRCNGQRYVFFYHKPHDKRKCTICIADFNPHNVRRNAEMMMQLKGESVDDGGTSNDIGGKKEDKEVELEMLDHEGQFSEEVYMGLKCAIYCAPDEYDFDGMLMDEERLLGLKFDGKGRYESMKIFYFG